MNKNVSTLTSIKLLYSILLQPDTTPKEVIKFFWSGGEEFSIPDEEQQKLVEEEIHKIIEAKDSIQKLITQKLVDKNTQLDKLVEAILLIGVYRILSNEYTIDKSFYKEFVRITSSLVSPKISGLVHAILESINKDERI